LLQKLNSNYDITPEQRLIIISKWFYHNSAGGAINTLDLYEITKTPQEVELVKKLFGKLNKSQTENCFFVREDYTPEETAKLFVSAWKQSSRVPQSNAVQLVMSQMDIFKGDKPIDIYFNEKFLKYIIFFIESQV
jgi:hypothetical protein